MLSSEKLTLIAVYPLENYRLKIVLTLSFLSCCMHYLFMGPICTLTVIATQLFNFFCTYNFPQLYFRGIFLLSVLIAFLLFNCCTCTLKWEMNLPV